MSTVAREACDTFTYSYGFVPSIVVPVITRKTYQKRLHHLAQSVKNTLFPFLDNFSIAISDINAFALQERDGEFETPRRSDVGVIEIFSKFTPLLKR